MKRAGGRRFYRPHDITVLHGVRRLLHDEGYTIKGVQRLYREQGLRWLASAGEGDAAPPEGDLAALIAPDLDDDGRQRLISALVALEVAKQKLDALLGS